VARILGSTHRRLPFANPPRKAGEGGAPAAWGPDVDDFACALRRLARRRRDVEALPAPGAGGNGAPLFETPAGFPRRGDVPPRHPAPAQTKASPPGWGRNSRGGDSASPRGPEQPGWWKGFPSHGRQGALFGIRGPAAGSSICCNGGIAPIRRFIFGKIKKARPLKPRHSLRLPKTRGQAKLFAHAQGDFRPDFPPPEAAYGRRPWNTICA